MRIYRGPASTNLRDESHTQVATITPYELERGVASGSPISFNVTKTEQAKRPSVCTVIFDESDVEPMIRGILRRFAEQQKLLKIIKDLAMSSKLAEEVVRSINRML